MEGILPAVKTFLRCLGSVLTVDLLILSGGPSSEGHQGEPFTVFTFPFRTTFAYQSVYPGHNDNISIVRHQEQVFLYKHKKPVTQNPFPIFPSRPAAPSRRPGTAA